MNRLLLLYISLFHLEVSSQLVKSLIELLNTSYFYFKSFTLTLKKYFLIRDDYEGYFSKHLICFSIPNNSVYLNASKN